MSSPRKEADSEAEQDFGTCQLSNPWIPAPLVLHKLMMLRCIADVSWPAACHLPMCWWTSLEGRSPCKNVSMMTKLKPDSWHETQTRHTWLKEDFRVRRRTISQKPAQRCKISSRKRLPSFLRGRFLFFFERVWLLRHKNSSGENICFPSWLRALSDEFHVLQLIWETSEKHRGRGRKPNNGKTSKKQNKRWQD